MLCRVRFLTTIVRPRSFRRCEGKHYTQIDRGLVLRSARALSSDLLFNGILASAQRSMGSWFYNRCHRQPFDCSLSAEVKCLFGRTAFSGREGGQKQFLTTRLVRSPTQQSSVRTRSL